MSDSSDSKESGRKGLFQRAAERLRNGKADDIPSTPKQPEMIERGPEQHADDDRMHISGRSSGT